MNGSFYRIVYALGYGIDEVVFWKDCYNEQYKLSNGDFVFAIAKKTSKPQLLNA